MAWTCDLCNRHFRQPIENHVCLSQGVYHFLDGKTATSLRLFEQFATKFEEMGPVEIYATKSMIIFKNKSIFAQVIYFGKTYIDVVFQFKERFDDNLCFRKIAPVPGTSDFNHHMRLMLPEDLNEEVIGYMEKAYQFGKNL